LAGTTAFQEHLEVLRVYGPASSPFEEAMHAEGIEDFGNDVALTATLADLSAAGVPDAQLIDGMAAWADTVREATEQSTLPLPVEGGVCELTAEAAVFLLEQGTGHLSHQEPASALSPSLELHLRFADASDRLSTAEPWRSSLPSSLQSRPTAQLDHLGVGRSDVAHGASTRLARDHDSDSSGPSRLLLGGVQRLTDGPLTAAASVSWAERTFADAASSVEPGYLAAANALAREAEVRFPIAIDAADNSGPSPTTPLLPLRWAAGLLAQLHESAAASGNDGVRDPDLPAAWIPGVSGTLLFASLAGRAGVKPDSVLRVYLALGDHPACLPSGRLVDLLRQLSGSNVHDVIRVDDRSGAATRGGCRACSDSSSRRLSGGSAATQQSQSPSVRLMRKLFDRTTSGSDNSVSPSSSPTKRRWPPCGYRHRVPGCFLPTSLSFSPSSSCTIAAAPRCQQTDSGSGDARSGDAHGDAIKSLRDDDSSPDSFERMASFHEPKKPTEGYGSGGEPLVLNRLLTCCRSPRDPCLISAELVRIAFLTLRAARCENALVGMDGTPQVARRGSAAREAQAAWQQGAIELCVMSDGASMGSTPSPCRNHAAASATPATPTSSGTLSSSTSPLAFASRDRGQLNRRLASAPATARAGRSSEALLEAMLLDLRRRFCELQACNVHDLSHERRLTFWLNVLNASTLAWLCVTDRPPGQRDSLFPNTAWVAFLQRSRLAVGAHEFSLFEIEHLLLRARPKLGLPGELAKRYAQVLKHDPQDVSLEVALQSASPEAAFGVACPIRSGCPDLRVYRPQAIKPQLLLSCAHYIARSLHIDAPRRRVWLPALFRVYARDLSSSTAELLDFVQAVLIAVPSAVDGVERLIGHPASHADTELVCTSQRLATELAGVRDPSDALEGAAGFVGATIKYTDFDWTTFLDRGPVCPELEETQEMGSASWLPVALPPSARLASAMASPKLARRLDGIFRRADDEAPLSPATPGTADVVPFTPFRSPKRFNTID